MKRPSVMSAFSPRPLIPIPIPKQLLQNPEEPPVTKLSAPRPCRLRLMARLLTLHSTAFLSCPASELNEPAPSRDFGIHVARWIHFAGQSVMKLDRGAPDLDQSVSSGNECGAFPQVERLRRDQLNTVSALPCRAGHCSCRLTETLSDLPPPIAPENTSPPSR